ncbi:MAG: hypothetical protein R2744_13490 [Bacteroidales bacterium]
MQPNLELEFPVRTVSNDESTADILADSFQLPSKRNGQAVMEAFQRELLPSRVLNDSSFELSISIQISSASPPAGNNKRDDTLYRPDFQILLVDSSGSPGCFSVSSWVNLLV